MEELTKGAWIVHHASKIEGCGGAVGMKQLRAAGNCGLMLSALCASDQLQLTNQKVATLAEAAGIDLDYQLNVYLEMLKERGLIELSKNGVEVLGMTTRGVLEHTARLFESLSPKAAELASIEVAELCSDAPQTEQCLREYVSDQYKIATKELNHLIGTVEKAQFCDTETLDAKTKLYFNGALFRGKSLKKVKAVLDSMTAQDQAAINSLEQQLRTEGCLERTQAEKQLGEALLKKIQSIGMYDVSTVSNNRESIEYVTKPSAFNKYGGTRTSDAFDLAKAFVASLQYGMTRSTRGRGRIVFLRQLLEKLIAGGTTRPCTAAGEDYHILEMKNVVQLIPAGNGMFSMKLLKRDVGEMALQVLESGDTSEQSLDVLPGSSVNRFCGPEPNRVRARRDAQLQNLDVRKVLDTLRTQSI